MENNKELDTHVRKIKYLVIGTIVVVLAVIVFGSWYFISHRNSAPKQPQLITYRDPGLTDTEKADYQKQIQASLDKLNAGNLKDDEKVQTLATLGQQYYMIGELAKARDYEQQAANINPQFAYIWEQLYQAARAEGDYKGAEQYIQKAADLAPQNAGYQNELNEIKTLEQVPR